MESPLAVRIRWISFVALGLLVILALGAWGYHWYSGRSAQIRTASTLNVVRSEIARWTTVHGRFPAAGELIEALGPGFGFSDAWGHKLVYSANGDYVLVALGRDGQLDVDSIEVYRRRGLERENGAEDCRGDFDRDMVVVDGRFIQFGGK